MFDSNPDNENTTVGSRYFESNAVGWNCLSGSVSHQFQTSSVLAGENAFFKQTQLNRLKGQLDVFEQTTHRDAFKEIRQNRFQI